MVNKKFEKNLQLWICCCFCCFLIIVAEYNYITTRNLATTPELAAHQLAHYNGVRLVNGRYSLANRNVDINNNNRNWLFEQSCKCEESNICFGIWQHKHRNSNYIVNRFISMRKITYSWDLWINWNISHNIKLCFILTSSTHSFLSFAFSLSFIFIRSTTHHSISVNREI